MKITNRKIIAFFVLLFLSFTTVSPISASTDTEDTATVIESAVSNIEESIEDTGINDWIKALQPVSKGQVTIKEPVRKEKKVYNYNLSSGTTIHSEKKVQDILPSWMNKGSCINTGAGFTFFDTQKISCQRFIVEGEGMNEFSKDFFNDVIELKRGLFLNNEEELLEETLDILKDKDETLDVETITTNESESLESEVADTSEDDIASILSGLDLGSDGEDIIVENPIKLSEEQSDDGLKEGENGKNEYESSGEANTSTGIVIGDISTSDNLKKEVDTVLEKFLNPDEYTALEKVEKITIEEEEVNIVENNKEDAETSFSLDELFPKIYVNPDIVKFTESLFGPEVKDVMYGAKIEDSVLSGLSSGYLAIALVKFREQKEILEISGNQVFGLQGFPHYNTKLNELFNKFLLKNPSTSEKKVLGANLSAISFSFSSYANSTLNFKTREVFKNKLIRDFQKLEKDYENISKQTTIRNFFLKR